MYKTCQKCFKKVPIARSTCDCGYMLRKKKDAGFMEKPIVLKSERLRNSLDRPNYSEDNEDKQNRSLQTADILNANQQPKEGKKIITEKLYPKRERHKTTKFEGFYKENAKSKSTSDNEKKNTMKIKNSEVLLENDTNGICLVENMDNAHEKVEESTVPKCVTVEKKEPEPQKDTLVSFEKDKSTVPYPDAYVFKGTEITISAATTEVEKRHLSKNSSLIQSPTVVVLRKPGGSFFTKNIDARIEIEINNDTKLPVTIDDTTPDIQPLEIKFTYNKELKKMVVTRDIKYHDNIETNKQNDTSNISNDLKRKRGRPRKHPVVIKIKRPVGRPRKNPIPINSSSLAKMSNNNSIDQIKRSRGRPKGAKDLKPRKSRLEGHKRISFYLPQNGMADGCLESPNHKHLQQRHVFLSPPQLLASAKRQHLRNEMLETVEKDKLEQKLKEHNGICIPEHKKELFSYILKDINQRIVNQSFKYHVM